MMENALDLVWLLRLRLKICVSMRYNIENLCQANLGLDLSTKNTVISKE